MAMLKNLSMTRPGGFTVSMNHDKVTKEEAYFNFEFTWLGKTLKADVTADRYLANVWDGDSSTEKLTNWRIIVRSAYDNVLTDAARQAADAVIQPIVKAWLNSWDYAVARQKGYANAIALVTSDERYDTGRARKIFAKYSNELSAADKIRLDKAINLLAQFLDSLKEA